MFHMLDDNLAQVLRALRNASTDGAVAENDVRMPFKISDGVKIGISPAKIRRYLEDCCGSDPEVYMRGKSEQDRGLGFEVRPFTLTATFEESDPRSFNEFFLGLKEARVSKLLLEETRFGVKLLKEEMGAGSLRITPGSARPCLIRFSARSIEPVFFRGKIRGAQAFVNGPATIHVMASVFELTFYDKDLTLTILNDAVGHVDDVANVVKLRTTSGTTDLSLDLFAGENEEHIVSAVFRFPRESIIAGAEISQLVSTLASIVHSAGVRSPFLTFRELYDSFGYLHHLVALNDPSAEFTPFLISQPCYYLPSSADALVIHRLLMERFSVGICAELSVAVASRESRTEMVLARPRILSMREIGLSRSSFDAYCAEHRSLNCEGLVLITGPIDEQAV